MLFFSDSDDGTPQRLEELVSAIYNSRSDQQTAREHLPELMKIAGRTLLGLRRSEPRFRESEWLWLSGVSPDDLTMADANAFICACFLEFRAGKTDVWDNCGYFISDILDNPSNLWHAITAHSPQGWEEQFWEYNLHPEKERHLRLYDIASLMIRYYHGDARQIWADYLDQPQEVFNRLKILGLPRSTACLVLGALKDEGYLEGPYDIVGDVVDSRVLGRLVCGIGSGMSSYQARMMGRMIAPGDPWVLDRPLYVLGMSTCAPGPRCRGCPARSGCVYFISQGRSMPIGTTIYEVLFGQKTVQKSLKRWLE